MIHEAELTIISEQIERKLGLAFPKNRFSDLKYALNSALPEIGFKTDYATFGDAMVNNRLTQNQSDTLVLYLTIGETYFFREKTSLDVFTHTIIPELIKNRDQLKREIRIWSAGCCTGEEAYTIAILLTETLPDIETWKITIIGTDINRNFLHKARNGRYTQWSFRDTPESLKKKYFTQIGKEFEVIPEIKKMVSFSYLNLAEEKYPMTENNTFAMDVIFCRNVLMYFSSAQAKKVVMRFKECLSHDGWFITSPVEVSSAYFSILNQVIIKEALLYRNGEWSHESDFQFPPHRPLTKTEEFKPANSLSTLFDQKEKKTNEPTLPFYKAEPETKKDDLLIDLKPIYRLIEAARYENALSHLQKLSTLHPDDTTIKFLMTKVFANMGKHAEARFFCDELISKDKLNSDYYYLLATILFDQGEKEAAEKVINQVLYIDPNHLMAHFLKANISWIFGKKQVATKHYENLLDLIRNMDDSETIADSGGLTVGRLKEMILVHV